MRNVITRIGIVLLIALAASAAQINAPKPAPAPTRWLGLIGEYGPDDNILYILEKNAKLHASFKRANAEPLQEISRDVFTFTAGGPHGGSCSRAIAAGAPRKSNSTRQRSRAAGLNPKPAPTNCA